MARSIQRVAVLARERKDAVAAERLAALQGRLPDDRLQVAVLGEFKRGKSTLINTLLGSEVLPAGTLPLTSVTTAIRFGPSPHATIELAEGVPQVVPISELSRFVTQVENPDNRLGVRSATVSYPSALLDEGIVLLDTPGVGSVHDENTEATRRMLPDIDVAIFVTSADPPVSASEREFLHAVAGHASRFFFVVNKIDRVALDPVESIIAFTRTVLSDAIGYDVDVFPMSALRGLEHSLGRAGGPDPGFAEFQRELWAFLVRERGEVLTTSIVGKAQTIAKEIGAGISVERRALDASSEDVDGWIRELDDIRAEADRFGRDIDALLRRDVGVMLEVLQEDIDRFTAGETSTLLDEAEEAVAEAGDLRTDRDAIKRRVVERLREDVDQWRVEEDERLARLFDETTARYVRSSNEEAERVRAAAARVLAVELPEVEPLGALRGRDRFTFSTMDIPMVVESLVPDVSRLLPAGVVARRTLEKVRKLIPDLVDKHGGRLRYALATRIQTAGDVLGRGLREHVEATATALGAALERATAERQRSASEIAAGRARLDEMDAQLSRLVEELASAASSPEGIPR